MWQRFIAWLKSLFAPKKPDETPVEPEPVKGTKRALVVGINKYQMSGNDLSGCVNDAEDVYELLVNEYGFERDNVRLLTDERATKENIKSRLTWLVAETKKDDTAVYYHSGHGTQVRDRNSDELDDCLDECLCVSGDMLITTDCGLVQAHRLYDVLQSGEQVKAKVGDEWHNIIASARTEKDRVVSICLQNGLYLTLGEEHKVFVFDNGRMIERKASEISVDDYLLFPCGPWKGNKDIDLTWYLVGLFVGDGCFVTESTVRFSVRRYKDFWRDIAIQAEKCHSLDAKVKVLENKRGDLNVTIRSRLFSSLLRGLGFKPKQRKMGHILELPIPMNEGCVKGFLRGLFDSDGSSSARQVTFHSTDYELCKLVTVLIGFFGVRGQISRRVVKNTRAHIGYTVGIYGFSAQLFLERIGFGIKEKAEKFKPNVYSRHGDAGRLSISELHNLLERWNFKFCDFSAALGIHKRNLRRTKTCQFTKEMALASVEFLGGKVKKADNLLMMKNAKVIENRKDIDASIEQIENCCGVNRYTAYSRLKKGNASDVRNYAELMKKDVSSFLERDWDILENYDVVRVLEVRTLETPIEMFDFTVENVEKFEVNGVLVHNCTYDFSWDDPFTDDEVAELLKPLAEGAYLNIVVDTCHSGSMTRAFNNEGLKDNKIKSIRPPLDIRMRVEGREAIRIRRFGAKFRDPDAQRHVLLSGCKDNEYSEESVINGRVRGALTFSMTKILRGQAVKDWKELHTKILSELQGSGFSQHPQLTGMDSLLAMTPFGSRK